MAKPSLGERSVFYSMLARSVSQVSGLCVALRVRKPSHQFVLSVWPSLTSGVALCSSLCFLSSLGICRCSSPLSKTVQHLLVFRPSLDYSLKFWWVLFRVASVGVAFCLF